MSTFYIVISCINLFNLILSTINKPSKINGILGWGAACLFSVSAGIGIHKAETNDDYKRGQVDAINGRISYHIVTNNNKETAWVLLSQDSSE